MRCLHAASATRKPVRPASLNFEPARPLRFRPGTESETGAVPVGQACLCLGLELPSSTDRPPGPRRRSGEAPPYCCQDGWVGGSPAVTWLDPGEPDARREWRSRYISARDLTTLAATCDPSYLHRLHACMHSARPAYAWTDLSLTSRAGGRRGPAIPIRSAAFSIGLSYAMKLLAFARGGLGWVGELGRTVTAVSCICGVPARWW